MNAKELPLFEVSEAAKSVDRWVAKKVVDLSKNRRRAMTKPQVQKARAAMEERVRASSWEDTKPSELVALYEWLHRSVYGVDPAMKGRDWSFATMAASRLIKNEFNGDPARAVEFVRWTWLREQGREKWRLENGRECVPIGWRTQFMTAWLLVDFRIAKVRMAGAR